MMSTMAVMQAHWFAHDLIRKPVHTFRDHAPGFGGLLADPRCFCHAPVPAARRRPLRLPGGQGTWCAEWPSRCISSASSPAFPASPDEAVLDRVAQPAPRHELRGALHRAGIHHLCPVTGQPDFAHLVIDYVPGEMAGRIEIAEALSRELPQHRRLPRGLHGHDRQAARGAAQAEMAADRRLLVSARRHADRRVLADRAVAGRRVAAGPGRGALSRAGIANARNVARWSCRESAGGASRRSRPSAAPPHRRTSSPPFRRGRSR